jgi:hypothetical protein
VVSDTAEDTDSDEEPRGWRARVDSECEAVNSGCSVSICDFRSTTDLTRLETKSESSAIAGTTTTTTTTTRTKEKEKELSD